MSRLCEILGIEPNKTFKIQGYDGIFWISENGFLTAAVPCSKTKDNSDADVLSALCDCINHPRLICRIRQWTEKDFQDAAAIKQLYPNASILVKHDCDDSLEAYAYSEPEPGMPQFLTKLDLPNDIFPNVKCGENIDLNEVIKCAHSVPV